MNYMLQDILGVFIALILFSLTLFFPGYVISFLSNILDFRTRRGVVQLGIAALVSASASPVLFFLAYRLGSANLAILLALAFAFGFLLIIIRTQALSTLIAEFKGNSFARLGLYISIIWITVATLFLVDLQWGNRLYYNIVSYDYTTRVSVIDAITRTGIPPINPSYFPGSLQLLTQVYYFWYILCSMTDRIGGTLVDARTSLIASVIWTGLILASTVALFIRVRSANQDNDLIWRKASLGLGLLLVSGLDVFPSTIYMLFPQLLVGGRIFEGDLEQWNEQITAWIGAITWTPHHVISLLACVLAWMIIASNRAENRSRQLSVSLIAGLALASAFGLSVWLTFIFVIFWGIWLLLRLLRRESLTILLPMVLTSIFAAVAISPFLIDLFDGPQASTSTAQFPLALNVRSFYPLEFITLSSPPFERMLINLLALPINYFLELGFFLIVGIIWIQNAFNEQKTNNPFAETELILLLATAILVTFFRSTIIVNNDFGWRGWMFGQFILLLWSVDILEMLRSKNAPSMIAAFQRTIGTSKTRRLLSILIALGVLTTIFDVVLLRGWPMIIDTGILTFPRILSPDNHLGERTFAAREAYQYIDETLPPDAIVQFDPRFTMDRPAGLYRTRTVAISYHTLYGVPESVYLPMIKTIGKMFEEASADWEILDDECKQRHIDVLIFRDLDPIWSRIANLKNSRPPLYENPYFVVFECGRRKK